MEQNLTLYYEVDANVWQAEADLDKTKVFVEAVTVLDGAVPAAGLPEKERCALAAVTLREIAASRGVELKLRRRPR